MARLDPQIASDTTIMLWQKARQAYDLFMSTDADVDRATLNKIVRCLATMLDTEPRQIAARLKDEGQE